MNKKFINHVFLHMRNVIKPPPHYSPNIQIANG